MERGQGGGGGDFKSVPTARFQQKCCGENGKRQMSAKREGEDGYEKHSRQQKHDGEDGKQSRQQNVTKEERRGQVHKTELSAKTLQRRIGRDGYKKLQQHYKGE